MVEEKNDGKKRGARGGAKHTPGRGHARKSDPQKKKRFRRKAATKRQEKHEALRKQWEEWDALTPDAKKLRPEMKPKQPRPTDEG